MKKALLLLFTVSFLYIACQTSPVEELQPVERSEEPLVSAPVETEVDAVVESPPAVTVEDDDTPYFDVSTVTQEERELTMAEVQAMISNLNHLIRSKDFYGWVANLLASYYEKISSAVFLKEMSDSDQLKKQKVVLKSAKDYFMYVVVPSRADERVDDIEFITHWNIKVYTIRQNPRTKEFQRLRLYDLQKTGDGWKISN